MSDSFESKLPPMPPLKPEAVRWRPEGRVKFSGTTGRPGCLWVGYLDASSVASMLDEWIGRENWSEIPQTVIQLPMVEEWWENPPDGGRGVKKRAEVLRPAVQGGVRFRVPGTDEWLERWDIGVPPNFSPIKGMWSDAFKRAVTLKLGVGRLIYDLPQISAPCRISGQGNKTKIEGPDDDTFDNIVAQLKERGFDGFDKSKFMEVEDPDFGVDLGEELLARDVNEDMAEPDGVELAAESHTVVEPAEASPASPAVDPAPAASAPAEQPAQPSAGASVDDAKAVFMEHPEWKQQMMEALKEDGLWPVSKLQGEDLDQAVDLMRRVQAAMQELAA